MKRTLMILSLALLLVGAASWTLAGVRKPASAVKTPPATERVPTATDTQTNQSTGSDVAASPSTSPDPVDATAPNREGSAPSATFDDAPPRTVIAEPSTMTGSAAYEAAWQALSVGGGVTTSASYEAFNALGGMAVGQASAAGHEIGSGFIYGATSGGVIICHCDCHADPGGCDGFQDVVDVVQVVNVAFRGAPAILDPSPLCPNQTTDVNCSGSTDVVDVVKMVTVAFRGANPLTEFCNPCP